MEWNLIVWDVVTAIFLILLVHRSTLTRKEDEQLFIDESSSSRATEPRPAGVRPSQMLRRMRGPDHQTPSNV
jgi:hypothetical protein